MAGKTKTYKLIYRDRDAQEGNFIFLSSARFGSRRLLRDAEREIKKNDLKEIIPVEIKEIK